MNSDRPSVFSFFAGSGLLDLGFETSGFDIVYVNEIFSPFMEAYCYARNALNVPLPRYGYHHGEDADVKKLLTLHAQSLRELVKDCRKCTSVVGFIGGPPCPDFSIGGKNRGYFGENGNLSAAYVELICQQKPDFFLFENVKGLWKTKKHNCFFAWLKYKLNQVGYILTERLTNSIEYGVPQDRERIILIGFQNSFLKNLGINPEETSNESIFP